MRDRSLLRDIIFIDANIWSSSLFKRNNQKVEHLDWLMESGEGSPRGERGEKSKRFQQLVNDRTGSRLTSSCIFSVTQI